MKNVLKKITTRAKALQKKHPGAKWSNLIKEAAKDYRSGRMQKRRPKKVSGFRRKHRHVVNKSLDQRMDAGLTQGAAKHFLKKEMEEKMSKALLRKELSHTKTDKKNARKQVAVLKRSLSYLKKL